MELDRKRGGYSKVKAAQVPSAGRESGIGYYGVGRDGKNEDMRTNSAIYRTRGGLLGLRPGEVVMFGILRHPGVARGWYGEVTSPGDMISGPFWTTRGEVARFERTKDGGILTYEPSVYDDANKDEAFGQLVPYCEDDEQGRKQDDDHVELLLANDELRNWRQFLREKAATCVVNGTHPQKWNYRVTLIGVDVTEGEVEVTVEPEETYAN